MIQWDASNDLASDYIEKVMIIDLENTNLHSLHKTELTPGVSLTCINTDKFKMGCVTVNLLCQLDRKTASANALLPRVLRRGTVNLPDMDSIAAALDDLYGVRIESILRKKGEMQCVGFYVDFPDDRYIPGGISVLEDALGIVCEMLLSPTMQNGLLRSDYIESEKSNLIDDIRSAINDKHGYSIDRLLEEMCADEAFGISKLGSEAEALAITAQTLTSHYQKLISDSCIEILYCGSAAPERVKTALQAALKALPERVSPELPKTEIVFHPPTDTPRRFTEALDVTQGKLTLGFRLGETMAKPDYPALMLLNALYGGSVSSKLFLNVREKLSLCYYASSMLDKYKGIMLVASGVDFSKFDAALDEILSQLESLKSGDISDWEFTSAKRSVITSIKSALDRPGGLEELYFDNLVSAVPYDPIDLSDLVEAVTPQRVIASAADIKTDSIYFLSGLESEVADNEA